MSTRQTGTLAKDIQGGVGEGRGSRTRGRPTKDKHSSITDWTGKSIVEDGQLMYVNEEVVAQRPDGGL